MWKCQTIFFLCVGFAASFSAPKPDLERSRRDFLYWSAGAGGAVAYGKLLGDAIKKLSRGDAYPPQHEQQVERTIARTLLEAANSLPTNNDRNLRVLEVGMGPKCRTVRRGLYNEALAQLSTSSRVTDLELLGIDLEPAPFEIEEQARQTLARATKGNSINLDFHTTAGDIMSKSSYSDGQFDAVICCLTLCSVNDPQIALAEMKRLVRPGGCFGYIEHVAVEPDEPYKFLEFQQETLDPLQQLVADNCHLHRYSEASI